MILYIIMDPFQNLGLGGDVRNRLSHYPARKFPLGLELTKIKIKSVWEVYENTLPDDKCFWCKKLSFAHSKSNQ